MDNSSTQWQIWIDTGGTFTDCIAIAPNGKKHRIKVLSTGRLRGVIQEQLSDNRFKFQANWQVKQNLFTGYKFRILDHNQAAAKIKFIDWENQILEIDKKIEIFSLDTFEITAEEEAPILATRLITSTALGVPFPPLQIRLGSTKGTNALLEKKGAPLTLIITAGFKDLLAIGTQQRPDLFQLNIPDPTLLYTNVIEVQERLSSTGAIINPLTKKEVERVIEQCKESNTKAIAISCLHAYLNPIHEQKIAQALSRAGFEYISISSDLSPNIQILPRTNTAVVDAYLSPIISNYLQNITSVLRNENFTNNISLKVMTSMGSLVDAQFFKAKDSLLSGPAGGIVGAARVAKEMGFSKLLSLDMGGTSTDTAHYNGSFDYEFVTKVGEVNMLSPSLAIETVAAGGGSICFFDGHKLCVGPKSAGADPGPACYGAGGPLTITDVNLLLGKMDPSKFGIPIQIEKAKQALTELKNQVLISKNENISDKEILMGLEQIANEKMADAIRKISIAKGIDPQEYALLVFGGAGGLHAGSIADLLGIRNILLPFDGGLLSAYGIGNAQIERLAEKQVLQKMKDYAPQLKETIEVLQKETFTELEKEGVQPKEVIVKSIYLYLRFIGQTNTIEISVDQKGIENTENILKQFKEKYQHLFGHWPNNKTIELESIKVISGTKEEVFEKSKEVPPYRPDPLSFNHSIIDQESKNAIYDWSKLKNGANLTGPAILLNNHSTAFIPAGWQVLVDEHLNALLQKKENYKKEINITKKVVELELFTNRFMAIAEEMGAQLQRTSFSVNIKERLDFSCAILDADAELLANAPHIPVHLGSLGICARLVRKQLPLNPGDVAITNHPKYGGSHLPDVTLVSAVFSENGERIGYVINRAHHAEIGGSRPGSMPPNAQNLAEEGVVISPMYLVKNGIVNWKSIEKILAEAPYPSRSITENIADIKAALASLKTGEHALQKLTHKYGLNKIQHYMKAIKMAAFDALNHSLKPYRNRIFTASEVLDDGHQIQVSIDMTKKKLVFDFTGTDTVHPYNLNANISIVYSAVIYVLRLLSGTSIPLNEGLMKEVDMILPCSFLNPDFPKDAKLCPAVVGGNTEVSQRVVDTLIKALGLAACSQGTMNNFLFGNEKFGYYETIGGGCGAGNGFHGRSAIHQHMTNTKITDPEELEWHYPVRLHRFSIRPKSGGAGQWNGGDGLIREIEFLEKVEMTLISQHRQQAPYGLFGGEAGKRGTQFLIRNNGEKEFLKGIDEKIMNRGDRIVIETPGGGAFGSKKPKSIHKK